MKYFNLNYFNFYVDKFLFISPILIAVFLSFLGADIVIPYSQLNILETNPIVLSGIHAPLKNFLDHLSNDNFLVFFTSLTVGFYCLNIKSIAGFCSNKKLDISYYLKMILFYLFVLVAFNVLNIYQPISYKEDYVNSKCDSNNVCNIIIAQKNANNYILYGDKKYKDQMNFFFNKSESKDSGYKIYAVENKINTLNLDGGRKLTIDKLDHNRGVLTATIIFMIILILILIYRVVAIKKRPIRSLFKV